MKSILTYYGGKQRMAHKIVPLIPKHINYVEPFFGGGAVFFSKPFPKITNSGHYKEIINDKDQRLIRFYRVFQNRYEDLYELLDKTLYSKVEYQKSKMILNGEIMVDEVWFAWAYFVNIQQSFASQLLGGWGFSSSAINHASVWRNKVEGLARFKDRMGKTVIECDDALKVIQKWDSPHSFFYCDPPYPRTDQGHYEGFALKDYENLIEVLDSSEGSFLLSNYEQDVSIPNDWEKFEFSAVMSCTNGRHRKKHNTKRTEIVYRRLNKKALSEENRKILAKPAFDCFG